MPGVTVTTDVRQGAGGDDVAPSSTFFVAGTAERGPSDVSTLIRSTAEFEKYYGGYNASFTLHQHVRTFFEEGGTRCYVARVTNSNGSDADVTLVDGASSVAVVTSIGKGAAYNDLTISVVDGYAASTRRLIATLDGVVIWRSIDLANGTEVVAAINNNLSHLVTAAAGAVTTLPDLGDYDLTGGADPSGEAAVNFCDALDVFGYELGAGAVAIPGQDFDTVVGPTSVGELIIAHCAANNRIALLAASATDDDNDLAASVPAWYSKPDADRAALYYPWVKIPDGVGGTMDISPESYVAGARARAHVANGPWKPGAGEVAVARYVSGLALPVGVTMTRAFADNLDSYQVNTIRVVADTIRVYGANTLSGDVINWRFITYRDAINSIVGDIEDALEQYVFTLIDGRGGVFAEVDATIRGLLEPISLQGGLYPLTDAVGNQIDAGYSVVVDTTNNTVADLAEGKLAVQVGLRVSPIGDTINVTIYKSGLTAAV